MICYAVLVDCINLEQSAVLHSNKPVPMSDLKYFDAATSLRLGVGNGILFGVPIPEDYAALAKPVESAINRALIEARYVILHCSQMSYTHTHKIKASTGKCHNIFLWNYVCQ
jgi:pseudouridine-5'-phosphate glycosidase